MWSWALLGALVGTLVGFFLWIICITTVEMGYGTIVGPIWFLIAAVLGFIIGLAKGMNEKDKDQKGL